MAKTEQQYYEELVAPLKKQAEELKANRTAADAAQLEQINAAIDQAAKTAAAGYEQTIADAPKQSRALYDENAMNEAVNRTRIRETLANMGMTDSGLTSSMTTALTLQKGKADHAVRMNEEQVKQQAMAAIDQIMANAESQKAEQKLAADKATREWWDNLQTQTETTARNNAATMYAADQEYAAKVAQAQIDAQNDYDNQRRQYVQKQMQDNPNISTELAWANSYTVYPSGDTKTDTYYAMVRNGYTDAEIQAYTNAGGGEAGAVALEAAAAANAEKMVSSMDLDITAGIGGWNITRPEKDGQRVVDSIKAQTEGNQSFVSLSKTEKEIAVAAAIGRMVATSWHHAGQTDRNKTRLQVACNALGADLEMATAYYDNYKVSAPDTRHI